MRELYRHESGALQSATSPTEALNLEAMGWEHVGAAEDQRLDDMTKVDLAAEADRRGVEVSPRATKADIVAAIEEADGGES